MYDEGSTLRGIFLTECIAFFLFSTYIFGFHLNHPEDMTVEPEVTEYEYCFFQPDLVECIPIEECEVSASSVDYLASSECQSTSPLNTDLPTAGEW